MYKYIIIVINISLLLQNNKFLTRKSRNGLFKRTHHSTVHQAGESRRNGLSNPRAKPADSIVVPFFFPFLALWVAARQTSFLFGVIEQRHLPRFGRACEKKRIWPSFSARQLPINLYRTRKHSDHRFAARKLPISRHLVAKIGPSDFGLRLWGFFGEGSGSVVGPR